MAKVFRDDQRSFLKKMLSQQTVKRKTDQRDEWIPEETGLRMPVKKSKTTTNSVDKPSRSAKLAESSRKRLSMSHFRSMNETLYTTSAGEASMLMDSDSFAKYHEAYRGIAEKWPVKPIDFIITKIRKMLGKELKNKAVLTDMGCGDKPLLAEAFPSLTVHSFDLVSTDERISPSSLDRIPLKNQSVDVVVYSLSLMAADLSLVMKEASRIVKTGGHVIIAEVASRFEADSSTDSLKSFVEKLDKFFGLSLKLTDKLQPNNFFLVFDFVKEKDTRRHATNDVLPRLSLKACQYKPR